MLVLSRVQVEKYSDLQNASQPKTTRAPQPTTEQALTRQVDQRQTTLPPVPVVNNRVVQPTTVAPTRERLPDRIDPPIIDISNESPPTVPNHRERPVQHVFDSKLYDPIEFEEPPASAVVHSADRSAAYQQPVPMNQCKDQDDDNFMIEVDTTVNDFDYEVWAEMDKFEPAPPAFPNRHEPPVEALRKATPQSHHSPSSIERTVRHLTFTPSPDELPIVDTFAEVSSPMVTLPQPRQTMTVTADRQPFTYMSTLLCAAPGTIGRVKVSCSFSK